MIDIAKQIHDRAREAKIYRETAGIKPKDMASLLGVNVSTLNRMERGLLTISDIRFRTIKDEFEKWRDIEIHRLQTEIKHMENRIKRLRNI